MDPSNTDQLYTVMKLSVQAVLNPALLPSGIGESPAATVARIRHYLTAPRRPLLFSVGDTIINLPGGIDDANGPFPDDGAFAVTMFSPTSFLVSWSCTVRLVDCDTGGSVPAYLSNRWTETNTYDENWYATNKLNGLLIVSSRGFNSPDDLRGLVTPGVAAGFRRISADYKLSEDGLHYNYSFVDRQLSKVPPFPATKMAGRQVESTTVNGGKRHGEINLTLTGPPNIPPRDLMNAGIRIAMNRVWASGPLTTGKQLVIDGSITENLDDTANDVSINLRWMMAPIVGRELGAKPANPSALAGFGAGAGGGVVGSGGVGGGIGAGLLGGGAAWVTSPGPGAAGPAQNATPTQQNKNPAGMATYAGWLGSPIAGSNPTVGIAPPLRGLTDNVKMVAAALRDPCGSSFTLTGSTPGFGDNSLVGTSDDGGNVSLSTFDPQFPPDDTQALYSTDDTPGVYDIYQITSHYRLHTGKALLPPPTDDSLCAFPQVHGAYMTCKVEWAATRRGAPPTIPGVNFGAQGDNAILLDSDYSPDGLDLAGDGVSVVYKAAGWLLFGFKDWKQISTAAPIPPFLDFGALSEPSLMATGTLDDSIISPSLTSSSQIVNPFLSIGIQALQSLTAGGGDIPANP